MNARTAFLVRCSSEDAEKIRASARFEDRTISQYVLHILKAVWPIQDKVRNNVRNLEDLNFASRRNLLAVANSVTTSKRTAILVRCSTEELERIRMLAKQGQTTLSGYVLHALRAHWNTQEKLRRDFQDFKEGRKQLRTLISQKRTDF